MHDYRPAYSMRLTNDVSVFRGDAVNGCMNQGHETGIMEGSPPPIEAGKGDRPSLFL